MPSYIVTIAERRTYEVDAGSEAEVRDLFREDEAERDVPIGALRSVVRTAIEVTASDVGEADALPADAHRDEPPSGRSDPRLPFSRGV